MGIDYDSDSDSDSADVGIERVFAEDGGLMMRREEKRDGRREYLISFNTKESQPQLTARKTG